MRYLYCLIALIISAAVPVAIAEPTPAELEQEIRVYTSLLKHEPENARYLNALGFSYYRLHRLDEAMTAYKKAAAADPGYAITFNNMGAIHLNRDEYAKAEQSFRKALELDPNYAKAAYNLGVALYRQRKYVEAYSAYRNVKKIDTSYVKKRMESPETRQKLNQETTADGERREMVRKFEAEIDREH